MWPLAPQAEARSRGDRSQVTPVFPQPIPNPYKTESAMLRTHNRIRTSLEALEARDTPAGTVSATFANGRLTITGDAADNTLLINRGWDNLLTISSNGSGTAIRLNGGAVLDEVTLPTLLTGAVVINLGDGKDELTIDAVNLPGSLTINGGNGAIGGAIGNIITLQKGVLVGGNLNITNLAGEDSIQLKGLVNVQGAMTIRNGSGGSTVSGEEHGTDLRVGGLFSIAGGAGKDKVDLWYVANVALGGIAFNSGPDAGGGYFRIHSEFDFTVAGGVRVTNGSGEDYTYLGGLHVALNGPINIQNGDGGSFNTLLSWGTLTAGQVTVTNGAGYDDNTIQIYDRGVLRGVSFTNGTGDAINSISGGNLLS